MNYLLLPGKSDSNLIRATSALVSGREQLLLYPKLRVSILEQSLNRAWVSQARSKIAYAPYEGYPYNIKLILDSNILRL